MVGPGDDRDTFVLGVARIGVLPFTSRVAPFFTVGAGLMTHSDRYGGRSYSSTEGALIVGGGVRINATSRIFIAPEFTMGWEPHIRASVTSASGFADRRLDNGVYRRCSVARRSVRQPVVPRAQLPRPHVSGTTYGLR